MMNSWDRGQDGLMHQHCTHCAGTRCIRCISKGIQSLHNTGQDMGNLQAKRRLSAAIPAACAAAAATVGCLARACHQLSKHHKHLRGISNKMQTVACAQVLQVSIHAIVQPWR